MMDIDNNVPLPSTRRATKYPFIHMGVGESTFCDGEKINGKAYRAAMSTGIRRGWKFIARNENNGIRIWRKE
jgi:hypothetical protein|tara:strand:- start:1743 stop:1958 length:216 start_codon:yes stop_codon:yes gene_type:complete